MNNPLSPHLQIYRWQITSVLSILHRITGVILSLGTIILAAWLLCLSLGELYFDFFNYLIERVNKELNLSINKLINYKR